MANIIENTIKQIGDQKTLLMCAKHFYTPSKVSRPTNGCADCWKALYVTIWAKQKTDEDKREFVEGLEMAIRHAVEHVEGGTWDLKLDRRPGVSVEHINDEDYVEEGPGIVYE